jgi:acylpyruvate hydrolase
MKLLTFSREGKASLGILIDGRVVDLAASHALLPPDLKPRHPLLDMRSFLEAGGEAMAAARQIEEWARNFRTAVSHQLEEVKIEPPIPDPRKVICIGRLGDVACLSCGIEPSPLCDLSLLTGFSKFPECLIGPGDPILRPRDWSIEVEGELSLIIGRLGKHIAPETAFHHIAGYAPMTDVSTMGHEGHPFLHKSLDASGALGPYMTTADEVADPTALDVTMSLNGEVCQRSNTRDLDFDIPYIVSSLSHFMTLLPGDIIACGMLAGAGSSSPSPIELHPGDNVTLEIDGLGKISNPVVADG